MKTRGHAMDHTPDDTDGDEQLLDQLAALLSDADRPPEEWYVAARAAYTWRTIDAELAALAHDSAATGPALSGVRGAGEVRSLTFEAADTVVDVEVQPATHRRHRINGQLAPARRARVELRAGDAVVADVETDEHGRFAFADVAPGPVSLRIAPIGPSDQPAVETGWVVL
jgi:hypothetical protein